MDNSLSSGIKKMLVGMLIVEYGMRQIPKDFNKKLHRKSTDAINSIREVQNFFRFNPKASEVVTALYEEEFFGNANLMIAEIIEQLHGLNEDDLEIILEGLKKHIQQ